MISDKVLADILASVGFCIGIVTKGYGVYDKDCVWTRRSSFFNVVTLPITAIYVFYLLEVYLTMVLASIKYFITCYKYLYRAPEGEDWLGRKQ